MSEAPRQAVILAGGRGLRMRPLTDTVPKHMLRLHGRPFLDYQLEMLREQGLERVLLLLGYRPEATMEYCDDGSRWGLRIGYRATEPERETSFRLAEALPALDDTFLLLYCDNYWPLPMDRIWSSYCEAGQPLAQMTVYENSDGYSRSNVAVGADGTVVQYDRLRQSAGLNGVDIGYLLMRREAAGLLCPAGDLALEAALYPRLVAAGQLRAYLTGHRYYGVGSPERLELTEKFLRRRPAVILDRDGVLNQRPRPAEYITDWRQWQWLDGALESLRWLHEAGYQVVVASNQAGVARGIVSSDALLRLDRRMKEEAREAGGAIDASYYCPHGWDAGCQCRKPLPGLLLQAQRDLHLDLSRTWFIGDDACDQAAAKAAGCLYGSVSPGRGLRELLARITNQSEDAACVNAY